MYKVFGDNDTQACCECHPWIIKNLDEPTGYIHPDGTVDYKVEVLCIDEHTAHFLALALNGERI